MPCSIATCSRPLKARGWCQYHYARWRQYGDPEMPNQLKSTLDSGPKMNLVTDAEAAWIAGLFEGEGCVTHDSKGYIGLVLQMTDQDVVERFATLVGHGQVRRHVPPQAHHKPLYRWSKAGVGFVSSFYDSTRPWLGARRRNRFEAALAQALAYRTS